MDKDGSNNNDSHCDSSEQFLRLLMLNNKRIYAYVFTLVHNHFDADDIMQETVSYMYRNFDLFEPESNFAAWGMRIAHYRVLAYRKKQRKDRIHFDAELLDLIRDEAHAVQEDINIRLEVLKKCREKLSKKDRKMLEMRYDLNVSVKDIGEYLGLSAHKVYRSVARIHDMLLRCIRRTLTEEY